MRAAAALSGLALLLGACATPLPPCEAVGRHGVARAFDPAEARFLADFGSAATEEVSRMLRIEPQPFRLHSFRHAANSAAGVRVWRDRHAAIRERVIEVYSGAAAAPEFVVAHEIVHWNVHGSPWDRLPHAVEEGLCDHIAEQLVPGHGAERRSQLKSRAAAGLEAPWEVVIEITAREWPSAPDALRSSAYPLGLFFVERIGLQRLREVCDAAVAAGADDVTTDGILAVAGIARADLVEELRAWGRTGGPHERLEVRIEIPAPAPSLPGRGAP